MYVCVLPWNNSCNDNCAVQLKCFHKRTHSGMDSIFRCQFPSAVVKDDLRLVFGKTDLDDAFKDKRFGENIKVELLFGEGDEVDVNCKCVCVCVCGEREREREREEGGREGGEGGEGDC